MPPTVAQRHELYPSSETIIIDIKYHNEFRAAEIISEIKSTGYSSRGPALDSQHPHGNLLLLYYNPRVPDTLFSSLRALDAQTYIQAKHSHK